MLIGGESPESVPPWAQDICDATEALGFPEHQLLSGLIPSGDSTSNA